MTYVQEARVRLERASEALTSDVASHDIVRAVLAGFRTLRTTHTADDVRRAIVKAIGKWAAVTSTTCHCGRCTCTAGRAGCLAPTRATR